MKTGHYQPQLLVVDDDEAVLAMAKAILEGAGFVTLSATSGEDAVEIYSQVYHAGGNVELVLLDITLPGGISGIEALDQLKRINPDVRVIASSGYFDESAAMAARRRGFVGILPKPYTADRLTKLVHWGMSQAA